MSPNNRFLARKPASPYLATHVHRNRNDAQSGKPQIPPRPRGHAFGQNFAIGDAGHLVEDFLFGLVFRPGDGPFHRAADVAAELLRERNLSGERRPAHQRRLRRGRIDADLNR